jgi:hypothetical protein
MRRPLFVCLVLIAGASCLGPATAVAAVPDRGVTYAGSTSAHDLIVFKLSCDGKHLVKMVKVWDAPCSGGGSLRFGSSAEASVSIDRTGEFAATSSDGVTIETGRTWFLDQHLKGRVRGHALSGSWHVDMRRYDAAGTLAVRCHTSFTFKATAAKGRIYGGVTSQDLPVLIRVAPRAAQVRHVDFAWESDCSSGDFLQTSDRVSNFKIVHGRFGDDFGSSTTTDEGEKLRLDYTVRGALRGARAAGRLGVRFTVRGSSGKLIDDCNSGSVSYKVSSG